MRFIHKSPFGWTHIKALNFLSTLFSISCISWSPLLNSLFSTMLFKSTFAVFLGVVFAHGSLAALTPDQIVSNIGVVTNVSANLNSLLGELTTSTSPGQISTFAQVIFILFLHHCLRSILRRASRKISLLSSTMFREILQPWQLPLHLMTA